MRRDCLRAKSLAVQEANSDHGETEPLIEHPVQDRDTKSAAVGFLQGACSGDSSSS